MLTATGRGVVKKADGTFDVVVEIREDTTNKLVGTYIFNANSQADLKSKVDGQLVSLAAAMTDATLNAAIVGKTISTI